MFAEISPDKKTADFFMSVYNRSSAKFGYYAELVTVEWLKNLCPNMIVEHKGTGWGADIKLTNRMTGEIMRVEVKAARKGNDGTYRATTYKSGHTDAKKHSDLIIFWCVLSDGTGIPFVIPTDQHQKSYLAITSSPLTYRGKLSQYRQNTSILGA